VQRIAGFLSDNCQNRPQINSVIVQQEKMDSMGFEPTTSAMSRLVYFNPRVDWQQFRDFLLQRMNERTAKDRRAAHLSLVSAMPWNEMK
jgi:hypothetical protein